MDSIFFTKNRNTTSFDELIRNEIDKQLVEKIGFSDEILQKINEIHYGIDFLLKIIIAQQKDACIAADIAPETLRRKILDGHLAPFSKDGSRLIYVSLRQIVDLKPRIRAKRKNRIKTSK